MATDDAVTVTDFTRISVLDNDFDPDGDRLRISGIPRATAAGGELLIFGRRLIYSPPAVETGGTLADSFTYTISDGDLTDTATVTVTVQAENEPPISANQPPLALDDTVTATEGTPETIAVLDNDSDPDGDDIYIVGFSATTIEGGTVTIDNGGTRFNPTDDTLLVYSAAAEFTGTDSFTYTIGDRNGDVSLTDTISDGDLTDTATVTVTAQAENEPPISVDDVIVTTEGIVYLDLADSGANPAATNEGVDDILGFNPAEDTIGLNFDVAPGTPVTLDDVQINLDFIEDGTALIGLFTPNTEPDFLPEQFAIRLSGLDAATTAAQIQNALIF